MSEVYEVDVFSGCAVLLNLEKFMEVGLFNEELFMYFDEADLSIRLKEKGYKVLYSSAHSVIHDTSYSTRSKTWIKTYFFTRNKFLLFGLTMKLRCKVRFIVHELAYYMKKRRWKDAYYLIKGVTDASKTRRPGKTLKPAVFALLQWKVWEFDYNLMVTWL